MNALSTDLAAAVLRVTPCVVCYGFTRTQILLAEVIPLIDLIVTVSPSKTGKCVVSDSLTGKRWLLPGNK